jgi:hypothetical protein
VLIGSRFKGSRFRVQGSKVQGSGFRVQGFKSFNSSIPKSLNS